MNVNLRLCLAAGALIAAACGDDSSSDDDTRTEGDAGQTAANNDASTSKGDAGTTNTENPSTGSTGGKCGKGEYKSKGPIEISFCTKSEADESCPALSELEGYTSYKGDLNLYPQTNGDLDSVSCLKSVSGNLTVSGGTEVTSLDGLSAVESLAGLDIVELPKLTSIDGFDNLKMLLQLTISGAHSLTDITGLPKGLKVKSLYVTGNKELAKLDALLASGIQIEDTLAFENNPKLSSCVPAEFAKNYPNAELSAFDNLTEQCN